MVRVDVKGIHRVTKKLAGGRSVVYHYAWRGGPRFWRSDDGPAEGGPDYWKAYRGALEARDPSAGKFRQIIRAYLASRDFTSLAARTQKDYQRSIFMTNGIDAEFGNAPVGAFNRPEIRGIVYAWRDKFSSPRVADHAKTHLVKIVNWAVDRNMLKMNHLAGMTSLYEVDRSEIIWSDAEIEAFCDAHPQIEVKAAPEYLRRMIVAATETGLRPQDLAVLSRAHIKATPKGRRIVIRTQKRKRVVSIPVTKRMGEIIDETPRDRLIIIVGERGEPYRKSASLGQQISRRRDEIVSASEKHNVEPPLRSGLRFYDCRGTAATRLFEADASLREIATQMGWSVQTAAKMIEVYVATHPDATDALLVKLQSAL